MWRIYTWLRLLLLGLAGTWGLCLPGVSRAAEMTLEELIEAVRQNELLYERIEFTWRCKYTTFNRHLLPPSTPTSKIIHEEDERLHVVYQPPYLLREEEMKQSYGEGEWKDVPFCVAFDGEKTRMLHDRLGNISKGFVRAGLHITPHNMLVHHWADMPLSLYLSGREAAERAGWNVGFNSSVKTSYQGVEEWGGLRCHRVRVLHYFPGKGESGATDLWLADERNYIPVRVVGYSYWISRKEPGGCAEVTEWHEVEPGIWFPWRASIQAYYVGDLRPPGKDNRQHRRDIAVESVRLQPEYDASYFRFEFPPKTYVYELEQGEIKKSYQTGSPADPNLRPDESARRRLVFWIGLATVGGIVGLIVAFWFWRKRRVNAAAVRAM
jgi:hypothetical protein